jgi:hypothetical protein
MEIDPLGLENNNGTIENKSKVCQYALVGDEPDSKGKQRRQPVPFGPLNTPWLPKDSPRPNIILHSNGETFYGWDAAITEMADGATNRDNIIVAIPPGKTVGGDGPDADAGWVPGTGWRKSTGQKKGFPGVGTFDNNGDFHPSYGPGSGKTSADEPYWGKFPPPPAWDKPMSHNHGN